ncbi:TPA: TIGR02391 family protein, partial [Klebsiella aerogenes]|nr:TIGR02391 family protein [Klebsiella aerogenes]
KGFNKQFEWNIDSLIPEGNQYKGKLEGVLYTSETPIRPNSGLRGISIFSRGKLVNNPEFYSNSTSSHFFQYLTGWISADFIDNLDDDVISTNRQSIDWDNIEMAHLREFLSSIISKVNNDWRNKRKEKKVSDVKDITGIDTDSWVNTMPDDIKVKASKIIDFLDKEDAIENYSPIIKTLHEIIPEYPMLHWRHLDEKIKDRIKQYYVNKQYGLAADQGTKIYCEIIREITGLEIDGRALTDKVFSANNPVIKISDLSTQTGKSMQEGQHFLSTGVMSSFRNVASHMPVDKLIPGKFSELDCLNILSLLTFLLERIKGAEVNKEESEKNN